MLIIPAEQLVTDYHSYFTDGEREAQGGVEASPSSPGKAGNKNVNNSTCAGGTPSCGLGSWQLPARPAQSPWASWALEPHPNLPANSALIQERPWVCLGAVPSPCPFLPRILPGSCCYRQGVGARGRRASASLQRSFVIWVTNLHSPTRPRRTTTKFSHLWNLPLPGRAPQLLARISAGAPAWVSELPSVSPQSVLSAMARGRL